MKVKTADLIDAPLDWAVGTALGLPVEICQIFQYGRPNGKHYISIGETDKDGAEVDFEPSEEWSQGGPLLEHIKGFTLKHWLESEPETCCEAHIHNHEGNWVQFGPTLLIAAMRCFVAAKLGDEIDVPKELLT